MYFRWGWCEVFSERIVVRECKRMVGKYHEDVRNKVTLYFDYNT